MRNGYSVEGSLHQKAALDQFLQYLFPIPGSAYLITLASKKVIVYRLLIYLCSMLYCVGPGGTKVAAWGRDVMDVWYQSEQEGKTRE